MPTIMNNLLSILDERNIEYETINNRLTIPSGTERFPDAVIEILSKDNNNLICRTFLGGRIPQEHIKAFLLHSSNFNCQSCGPTLHYNPQDSSVYFLSTTSFLTRPRGENLKNFLYEFTFEGLNKLKMMEKELLPFFMTPDQLCRIDHPSADSVKTRLLEDYEYADAFVPTNKAVDELIRLIQGKTQVIIVNTQDPQYAKFVIHMAAESLKHHFLMWNKVDGICAPNDIYLYSNIPTDIHWASYQTYVRNFRCYNGREKIHTLLNDLPKATSDEINGFGINNTKFERVEQILDWYKKCTRSYVILAVEDIELEALGMFGRAMSSDDDTLSELRELSLKSSDDKTLIIINNNQKVPDELVRFIPQVDCQFPDRGTLALWCIEVEYSFGIEDDDGEIPEEILDALQGMTTTEARNAISSLLYEKGKFTKEDAPVIAKMKRQIVNNTDYLKFIDTDADMTDIGGMDKLKEWIRIRESIQSPELKDLGIQSPKGILLVGPPGTGKTLAAMTIAKMWHRPLIEFEIGTLFGPLMGDSEHQTRKALANIDSLSPCILLIDEIEKGMNGGRTDKSNTNDTTLRVMSMLMKWMQNRDNDVFIVATANSVDNLPPELLRKGRFDEIFFVDLPRQKERTEILSIHLKKHKQELFSEKSMKHLSVISEGYSGTELEHAIKEALIKAFSEKRKLTANDVENAIKAASPLSVRHSERIIASRIAGSRYGLPVSSESTEIKIGDDPLVGYR